MKARVIEMQIGGGVCVHSLEEACREYIRMLKNQEIARTKIHFAVEMPDGEIQCITIRDEDAETVAYGDFKGLPGILDYAREVEDGKG